MQCNLDLNHHMFKIGRVGNLPVVEHDHLLRNAALVLGSLIHHLSLVEFRLVFQCSPSVSQIQQTLRADKTFV